MPALYLHVWDEQCVSNDALLFFRQNQHWAAGPWKVSIGQRLEESPCLFLGVGSYEDVFTGISGLHSPLVTLMQQRVGYNAVTLTKQLGREMQENAGVGGPTRAQIEDFVQVHLGARVVLIAWGSSG